jgi:hypothetical protein
MITDNLEAQKEVKDGSPSSKHHTVPLKSKLKYLIVFR